MANGKRTLRKFTLYSEELLNYKGIRCGILLLHLISFLLGISGAIIGIVSIANDSVPQTNCSLSTNTEDGDGADFPLNVLLLITGFVLVFTDIASTALLCVINFKVQRCGVFAIVWYLSTTVVLVIWTAISVVHVSIVIPVWMDSKDTCDDLVVVMALLCVVYGGVLTVVYVAVVVVVLSYEYNRSRKLKELH